MRTHPVYACPNLWELIIQGLSFVVTVNHDCFSFIITYINQTVIFLFELFSGHFIANYEVSLFLLIVEGRMVSHIYSC